MPFSRSAIACASLANFSTGSGPPIGSGAAGFSFDGYWINRKKPSEPALELQFAYKDEAAARAKEWYELVREFAEWALEFPRLPDDERAALNLISADRCCARSRLINVLMSSSFVIARRRSARR
jgi:hypothetical protein